MVKCEECMNEGKLTQNILEWYPPERKRNGKPRNSWMQEITTWNGSKRKNEGK
jgi:hypothetical protein